MGGFSTVDNLYVYGGLSMDDLFKKLQDSLSDDFDAEECMGILAEIQLKRILTLGSYPIDEPTQEAIDGLIEIIKSKLEMKNSN